MNLFLERSQCKLHTKLLGPPGTRVLSPGIKVLFFQFKQWVKWGLGSRHHSAVVDLWVFLIKHFMLNSPNRIFITIEFLNKIWLTPKLKCIIPCIKYTSLRGTASWCPRKNWMAPPSKLDPKESIKDTFFLGLIPWAPASLEPLSNTTFDSSFWGNYSGSEASTTLAETMLNLIMYHQERKLQAYITVLNSSGASRNVKTLKKVLLDFYTVFFFFFFCEILGEICYRVLMIQCCGAANTAGIITVKYWLKHNMLSKSALCFNSALGFPKVCIRFVMHTSGM